MQFLALAPEQCGLYSPLVLDYLNRDPFFHEFISAFPSRESYRQQIELKRAQALDRAHLVSCLRDQYRGIRLFDAEEENLKRLENDRTWTITTGQQIHVFLGPMYVYWKIVSTIALCRRLGEEFPGEAFVPVFWMATEDHDYAEINHLELFGRKLEWTEHEGKGLPVGRLECRSILPLLDQLDEYFVRDEGWKKFSDLFRRAYSESDSLATASRKAVHELFGRDGLIIIDPDDATLKRDLIPLVERELLEQPTQDAVSETTERLGQRYGAQLHPREINLFFTSGNGRERIEPKGDYFHTQSGTLLCSRTEVKSWVRQNIGNISTNASLRPVYQEMILPNLAYVGGPGEIAYWMQLKGAFDFFQVPFPLLENRKSVFIIREKQRILLGKMNLDPKDLFLEEQDIRKLLIIRNNGVLVSIDREIEKLLELKHEIIRKAATFVPREAKPIAELFNQTEKYLKKIEREIYTLQEAHIEKGMEKVLRLKSQVKDTHHTQERNQYLIQYLSELETGQIISDLTLKYAEIGPVSLLLNP